MLNKYSFSPTPSSCAFSTATNRNKYRSCVRLHKHIIKTRQTIIKPLKCFKLHDRNSKIFSDKILLNKSLVLCSVKHYPSTLLKGKLKKIQSILYCYNVGNM